MRDLQDAEKTLNSKRQPGDTVGDGPLTAPVETPTASASEQAPEKVGPCEAGSFTYFNARRKGSIQCLVLRHWLFCDLSVLLCCVVLCFVMLSFV